MSNTSNPLLHRLYDPEIVNTEVEKRSIYTRREFLINFGLRAGALTGLMLGTSACAKLKPTPAYSNPTPSPTPMINIRKTYVELPGYAPTSLVEGNKEGKTFRISIDRFRAKVGDIAQIKSYVDPGMFDSDPYLMAGRSYTNSDGSSDSEELTIAKMPAGIEVSLPWKPQRPGYHRIYIDKHEKDSVGVWVGNYPNLDVEIFPKKATIGQGVVISGDLDPGIRGWEVAIGVYSNGREVEMERVETDSSGNFSWSWIPESRGAYEIKVVSSPEWIEQTPTFFGIPQESGIRAVCYTYGVAGPIEIIIE